MPITPGVSSKYTTLEGNFLLQDQEEAMILSGKLTSTAVDAGSTVTTILRPGLALAEVPINSGTWLQYDASQTDGREIFSGFLLDGVNMLDDRGIAQNQAAKIVVAAFIDVTQIYGFDSQARSSGQTRFIFRDIPNGPFGEPFRRIEAKTGNYVVVAGDTGKIFTTLGAAGAVQFTLPALAAVGRDFNVDFINEVGQNMTIIRAGADTIVAFNNLVAVSFAFSTAANLISARLNIRVNSNKTKFIATPLGPHTATIT